MNILLDNSDELINDFITDEGNGVRIRWEAEDKKITIQLIEDCCVLGAEFEPKSYFDYIWTGALKHLHQENKALEQKLDNAIAYKETIAQLQEHIAVLNRTIFGTSSEQTKPHTEIEVEPEIGYTIPTPIEAITDQPNRPKLVVSNAGRKKLPENLPRERIEYTLSPEKQFCECCAGKLHELGEEVTERLTKIPAVYKVLQHVRKKYVCKACDKFILAEAPKSILPGSSFGSPEILADIAVQRFQWGLPYYRQEAILKQMGLPFNRTTLANLMQGCADKMVSVYEVLKDELRSQNIIHADETVMQVLKEPGRKAETQSYLWQYRSSKYSERPIVLFEYQPTRSGVHPLAFLTGNPNNQFKGFLCVDGYSGYNNIPGITRTGCMAHIRRKFDQAYKTLPAGSEGSYAKVGLDMIGKLYAIESRYADDPPDKIYRARQSESLPIMHEIKSWLDDLASKVLPKSLLGKAVNYALGQWPYAVRYCENGELAIDNNIAEREIKAVVIGRKNWLFADSVEGANTNAIMYSLVQTAKANNINPYDYLHTLFERLPYLNFSESLQQLMPWHIKMVNNKDYKLAA